MGYVDLDELDELLDGRLVRPSAGLLRFRRADYLGDPSTPLATAVRELVAQRCGVVATGPVRLLTQLRSFGHCFNPISLYYCFADDGHSLRAVVAEVTNTPWKERHAYVVPVASGAEAGAQFDKQLHVSPFMGMNQRYQFHAGNPGDSLVVRLANYEAGDKVFEATLRLRRTPLDATSARRLTWRYAGASRRILAAIYAHALVLRLKGVRVRRHPQAVAR